MKNNSLLILCLSLTAAIFTACNENENVLGTPVPDLEVNGGETTFTIPAEGGMQTLTYHVSDPVEGGKIEAGSADADWIHSFNCETENTIIFVAEPNTGNARSCQLTVTYTYGGGEVVSADLSVVQSEGVTFDYKWEMSVFRGVWMGNNDGLYNAQSYRVWMSDTGWEDDKVKPGGTYYQFEMFAPFPDDKDKPYLPAGTYSCGAFMASEEWTFDQVLTTCFCYGDDGKVEYQTSFNDGTVTVSYEDDVMYINAVLTDIDGKSHYVTYKGDGLLIDERPLPPGFGKDVDINPVEASSMYLVHFEDQMEIYIQFDEYEIIDGEPACPLTELGIHAVMAYDKYGYLQTGTYGVGTNEIPCVYQGIKVLGMLGGTCAQQLVSEDELYYTYITGGSMTVEGGYGNYTISCSFTCVDGYQVTCNWSGELKTIGMPGNSSTLDGDYTLDLEGASASGFYWGDFIDYGTGTLLGRNWFLKLNPGDGGNDGFMADFVSGIVNPNDGIPTGTYTIAESQDLEPWTCLKGQVIDGTLVGTAYMGNFDEDGHPVSYAPAASGEMEIVNNGDGTYQVSFEFLDDKGNTWDGEWSGAIVDESSAPRRRNYVELPGHMVQDTERHAVEQRLLKHGYNLR